MEKITQADGQEDVMDYRSMWVRDRDRIREIFNRYEQGLRTLSDTKDNLFEECFNILNDGEPSVAEDGYSPEDKEDLILEQAADLRSEYSRSEYHE